MKIQDKTNNIETSGLTETGSFSIKASPHAFQILSSGLYSNKIRAVIRELSCNAVDAHTAAKNKDPIEVKLPNNLDKQFYVKDYGTGLTHEQVMKLYTTYFESTKQGSNDFIGGLGVGSKSPFAYTDSFTVESRKDGKKRLYAAYLDETSMPAISKMSEEDTDEPNGLTIGFPVLPADFKEFEREACDVFRSFKQTPAVKGSTATIKKQSLSKLTKLTDTVYELGEQANGFPWKNCVRMGNVIYPLDVNKIAKDNPWLKWMLCKNGIFIEAPIGTYAVAASREQLQYDPMTIKKINNDMNTFFNAWLEEARKLEATVKSLKDPYDKKHATRRWLVSHGLEEDFYLDNDDYYDDEDYIITIESILDSLKTKHQVDIAYVDSYARQNINSKSLTIRLATTNISRRHDTSNEEVLFNVTNVSKTPITSLNISHQQETRIIIVDVPSNINTLGAYLKTNSYARYEAIEPSSRLEIDCGRYYLLVSPRKDGTKEEFTKELEELKTAIGISSVVLASTFPVVKMIRTPTKINPNKDTEVSANLMYTSKSPYLERNVQNKTLTPADTFVWIPFVKKTALYNDTVLIASEYETFKNTLATVYEIEGALDIKTTKLYAINPKYVDKLKNFPNAMSLENYLTQLLSHKKLKTILEGKTELLSIKEDDSNDQEYSKRQLTKLINILKNTKAGPKLSTLLNKNELETALTSLCLNINTFFKQDIANIAKKSIKQIDYTNIYKKIIKRYPLLDDNLGIRYATPKQNKELIEYITWKDTKDTTELDI